MVFAITKNDIIRFIFGMLAVLLLITGVLNAISNINSIIGLYKLIEHEFEQYINIFLPSFFAIPAIFLNLAALILFAVFLISFSAKQKKLFTSIFVLSATSSLLMSIAFVVSNLYPELSQGYLYFTVSTSIAFLIMVVLFTILAVKISKGSLKIKNICIIAIICGLLPSLINFMFYLLANRLSDLNLFRAVFLPALELIIFPMFVLICAKLFVQDTPIPNEPQIDNII